MITWWIAGLAFLVSFLIGHAIGFERGRHSTFEALALPDTDASLRVPSYLPRSGSISDRLEIVAIAIQSPSIVQSHFWPQGANMIDAQCVRIAAAYIRRLEQWPI